ncbi:type 2 lantipeptide synthetase LanM [Haloferax mediterranei ATCC 33500]|uniref:Lantibiotic modifying enzyme n=1 Tax=Haloferax mediterranei (strain ATCC 33500 / DSM 1411 / JCM 8866 / NBRC 14739 / NCIMB 2177 / R-4) TaxID=523841 RepID=I3R2Y0_HALMT|nr:type 2 lanthipeptide synthetase LanM family protein [Haloferax mediterranei]AFK18590.1 lantibiotic modifying enzyme [Haloferax mediterranei ATCC 33500]AHZ22036.1 lantibiotic modifying enzyme [Haloferax mediterranei ATCC 33500]EMA02135.1 lantibiotic modifying enzyme [Haloferax mediterranei ATCC 33500]MDX5988678.1 type 2 lanthipeptide synthetase LanM family protein [Haloferax mediterranei ATCC 33500]QCQ75090.1 type 2 lantipeptide synthetase LanM [Haloferax mediterranei ATCC 33500]
MTQQLAAREKRAIAGQARTLHERLEGPPNDHGDDPPIAPDDLLDKWRELFSDAEAFHERLAYDDLTESEVRYQLTATHWPATEPLPDWIDRLDSLLAHVSEYRSCDEARLSAPKGVPFSDLLVAFADYGLEQLDADTRSQPVAQQLGEWLIARLSRVSVRALYVEFKSFVEYHDPDLAAADPATVSNPGTTYYDQFIDAMFDGGIRKFCLEYPVLARYFTQLVTQWVTTVTLVQHRLQADRSALEARFGVDGAVTEFVPLADDTHAGGQVPVRVSFESGSVIYKPRPIDAGVSLYEVLERLDDYLETPSFSTPEYLSREGYGWMEPIEYDEPTDTAAVERYYERAGVLLCVAYVLDLPDCQYENLIVRGEQPTIIDAETLFHPPVSPTDSSSTTAIAAATSDTVLRTALLPWKVVDSDDDGSSPFLAAGLGRNSETKAVSEVSKPVIKAANTDVMTVEGESPTVDRRTNTPSVDGVDRPPERYLDAIVGGFQRTHETVCSLHEDGQFRTDILTSELVERIENRLVYRPTATYSSILRLSRARDPLRDGARLSVELERLAAPFFDGRIESDRFWGLFEAERRSLLRRDVPRFTAQPDQTMVSHDGTETGVSVDTSGYERCLQRLDAMDAADRQRQTELLRRCLDASIPDRGAPASPEPVTDDRLQREAVKHGDMVLNAAIETEAGRQWVSYIGAELPQLGLSPADNTLYAGRGGIGIAAAALYDQTGHSRFEELAVDCLDAVASDRGVSETEFGGITGTGSLVYSLSVAADLLDRPVYRERAAAHARAVTTEQLAADETFDVIDGTAGVLLGLLAHYERYGGSTVLDRALDCGKRLLDNRVSVDGHHVWTTGTGKPLPGMAHGQSGIAYALARLGAVVDDDRYETAAREALAYESTLYDPEQSNYPIPTDAGDPQYLDRWCEGRTGCALARLGIGSVLDDEALLTEANQLLSATASADRNQYDQLCCGTLGQATALLESARRTGRDETDARALVDRCVARQEQSGALCMPGHSRQLPNSTFFNGGSGVAYSLLRFANPDELPCVLLLE